MFQHAKKRPLLIYLTVIAIFSISLYHLSAYKCPVLNITVTTTLKSVQEPPVESAKDLIDPDSISCHYWWKDDALPSAEEGSFLPPRDSIFFHETSCRGVLNSRQACAVESAARAHPHSRIFVLFSAPVTANVLNLTRNSISELKRLPNVEFARVHIDAYAKGTVLEQMLKQRTHNSSKWKVVHTSDMLRFLTLSKFGGMYLDTDFVVARSMSDLGRNWVAAESGSQVNNAVVNVAKDALGQEFIRLVLEEISTSYRPDLWLHNGPGALNRVLTRFCNTSEVEKFSSAKCQGFKVYGPEIVYPIPYSNFKVYFDSGDLQNDKAYAFHMWNKMSHDVEMKLDSPYYKMGEQFCPMTHELYGDSFGF